MVITPLDKAYEKPLESREGLDDMEAEGVEDQMETTEN